MGKRKNLPTWIGAVAAVFAALATAGIFGVALWIGSTQKEVLKVQQEVLDLQRKELSSRKVAIVEAVGISGGFKKIGNEDSQWVFFAEVNFRNISKDYEATRAQIIYQAFDGTGWTGYFDKWIIKGDIKGRKLINFNPGKKKTAIMSSQTVANPKGDCMGGKRFMLAFRIDWVNPNGAMGCQMNAIQFACPIGPTASKGEFMVRFIPPPVKNKHWPPPAIWPCPE
jgi:hypothetical protein